MNPIKFFFIGIKTIFTTIFSLISHFILGIFTVITIIPRYLILGIQCIFDQKKQEELKMNNKIIPIIITTLSITTYLLSIFIITRWYVQTERNKKFTQSLKETTEIIEQQENNITTENTYKANPQNENIDSSQYPADLTFLNVNLNSYITKNPETVAWLQVNGTNISYPVVQHQNNDYYLNHDFYNKKTSAGWVFGDYRDNFEELNNNTIIYAHNLINRTMFGQIPYLLKNNWQSNPNNHYIKLSTKTTNTIWQIFSVYKTKPTTDYLQVKFNDIDTYKNFLENLKNKSSYNFNTEITEEDKIITLSTCDDTGTKRIAVHAKLIQIQNK